MLESSEISRKIQHSCLYLKPRMHYPNDLYQLYHLTPCVSPAKLASQGCARSTRIHSTHPPSTGEKFDDSARRLPNMQPRIPQRYTPHQFQTRAYHAAPLSYHSFHRMMTSKVSKCSMISSKLHANFDYTADHTYSPETNPEPDPNYYRLPNLVYAKTNHPPVSLISYNSEQPYQYDMILSYNWGHTVQAKHIVDLYNKVSRAAYCLYYTHVKIPSYTIGYVWVPVPTIGALSDLIVELFHERKWHLKRRGRNSIYTSEYTTRAITTLLSMGVRWHPAYSTTEIIRPVGDILTTAPLTSVAYPIKQPFIYYYLLLRKYKTEPIFFVPYQMVPCDIILYLMMIMTCHMYLPYEIRIHLVTYIDMLALPPSVNSVERYINGYYF